MELNEENLRNAYYSQEMTQQECADFFGYSKRTIANHMKKFGMVGRVERNKKWRERISNRLIGNTNSEGIVFSEKTRQLISINSSKALQEKIKKEGYHWGHTGHKHSEETKNILRNSQIKKLKENFYKGKVTKLEKKGYEKLDNAGIEYEPQKQIGFYLVDAYIPKTNTIVEFQGIYWHTREDIKAKDKAKRTYFKNKGYNLIEVWEDKIQFWNPKINMGETK